MTSIFPRKFKDGWGLIAKTKDPAGKWRQKRIEDATFPTKREAQRSIKRAKKALAERAVGIYSPDVDTTLDAYLEGLKEPKFWREIAAAYVRPHLGHVRLADLDPPAVQRLIDQLGARGLQAQTIKHARGVLRAAINRAIGTGLWAGANPAAGRTVRLPAVQRQPKKTLLPHEILPVLGEIDECFRPFVAIKMGTGARTTSLARMAPGDVHLGSREFHFRDTKTGTRFVPIAAWILPYVQEALSHASDDLLFPGNRGHDQVFVGRRLSEKLKSAMVRAALKHGINSLVTGWVNKCRHCGWREQAATASRRPCPECGFALWPTGTARPMDFRSLRHTVSTLLWKNTDPKLIAQLQGNSVEVLQEHYVELDKQALRDAINSVSPPPVAEAPRTFEITRKRGAK